MVISCPGAITDQYWTIVDHDVNIKGVNMYTPQIPIDLLFVSHYNFHSTGSERKNVVPYIVWPSIASINCTVPLVK